MYNITYPEERSPDEISGREIAYHNDDPDQFMILTWWRYSKVTGEYDAIKSTWKFQGSSLYLEHVSVKHYHLDWMDKFTDPSLLLSDVHLRLARKQVTERIAGIRCRTLKLFPAPKEEK